MARRPARPCLTPGCPRVTRNGSRCPEHQRQRDQQRDRRRGSAAARGHDYRWQQLSREAIAASPICANCGAIDDLTTDHPIALARGGDRLPSIDELVVLCRSCNSSKGAR